MAHARSHRLCWSLFAAVAVVVHLAVLFGMGTMLPQAGAAADQLRAHGGQHQAHAPLAADGAAGSRDPYIDLTPPEVRSLGGGGALAEHVDAPPSVLLARVVQVALVDVVAPLAGAHSRAMDGAAAGRAPPAA